MAKKKDKKSRISAIIVDNVKNLWIYLFNNSLHIFINDYNSIKHIFLQKKKPLAQWQTDHAIGGYLYHWAITKHKLLMKLIN